jgi:hypothetical protein
MPNPTITRRIGLCLVAGLFCASVGCGWTHGRYQSDPMLGSFNRPIAATPPIFTGTDPGVSPAYDAGARIGLPSPDVAAPPKQTDDAGLIVPTYQGNIGMGNLFRGGAKNGGASGRFTTPVPTNGSGGVLFGRPISANGARLPTVDGESDKTAMFTPGIVSPLPGNVAAATPPRGVHAALISGSSIEPNLPKPKVDPAQQALQNPQQVSTIEQAQSALSTCGARTQALEQTPTGEWRFVCTMGDGNDCRRYEAKHSEPIEAVRAVLFQVSSEK